VSDLIEGRSFVRRGNTLVPADEISLEYLQKQKQGSEAIWTRRNVRSPANHRHAFALFHLAFEMLQPDRRWPNVDKFRKAITKAIGYTTPLNNVDGTVDYEPDSLRWDKMDEDTFQGFKADAIGLICSHLLFCDEEEFVKALEKRTRQIR
jgi:hypothetical protein